MTGTSLVGTDVELTVGPVAHGGHCVGRSEGRVVFVRHALPGEQVRAVVTEGGTASRYLRADAVAVVSAAPDRVPQRCPVAGPGGCGGCDWQHVSVEGQRALKAEVVAEQLRRLAGVERAVQVEAVPGDAAGLGWRTRLRLAVDREGRAGLRRHRSHQVVHLADCPLSHPAVEVGSLLARRWPGAGSLAVAVSVATGDRVVLVDGVAQGRSRLAEHAAGRSWRVTGDGFWQVHPGAADALVDAVRAQLRPRPGEQLVDLYAGVGLFAGALADDLGPAGGVDAVEAAAGAVRDARRNLHDRPGVRLHEARVDRWLRGGTVPRADLVVLDPPRIGAGAEVVRRIVGLGPRAVAYVACDPAALARDVGTFRGLGWELTALRALDTFPLTHHVECVALLQRGTGGEIS